MKVADLHLQSDWNIGKINRPDGPTGPQQRPVDKSQDVPGSFGDLLTSEIEKRQVKFSSHAIKRLDQRSVEINAGQLERLDQGLKMLEDRGAQTAVVMIDSAAYVVSVENRTVVTALEPGQDGKKIFTNIDSLAIV